MSYEWPTLASQDWTNLVNLDDAIRAIQVVPHAARSRSPTGKTGSPVRTPVPATIGALRANRGKSGIARDRLVIGVASHTVMR